MLVVVPLAVVVDDDVSAALHVSSSFLVVNNIPDVTLAPAIVCINFRLFVVLESICASSIVSSSLCILVCSLYLCRAVVIVDDNECILLICDVTNNSNMNSGVVAGCLHSCISA